jgi:succinyl-diaminopimelate desuccinylase
VTALAERLAARTLELVNIPSESGNERRPDVPLVVLAGHYDTVPAQGNIPGRIEDGVVHGLGASDMKGGVAVALELVRDLSARAPGPVDVALLLFGREELPYEHDPLPALLEISALAREASLAILLEPTDGLVHAGCLGNVIARLAFHGRSGHSARPWDAENAIARAVYGLEPLLALEHRRALVDGLAFVEVLSVTRLHAGIADNVIPDLATATLSLRYPPDRTPREAEEHLRSLCPPEATVEIMSHAPAGRVAVDNSLVDALLVAGADRVEPKQAWTNVADFTARGIDAVNFGPGHTRYAHRRDEQVEVAALVHAYETLERLLVGTIGEDAR